MPAARRRPTFELLVDDLFIRLRCLSPSPSLVARTYPLYGLTEEPHLRAISKEAKVWWLTNELSELDRDSRRWLICEIFQRSPNEAALLALALFSAVPFPELRLEDIEATEAWFDGPQVPPRNVRDALVLKVWVPWFSGRSPSIIDEKLPQWLKSTAPLIRASLVFSVGLANESAREVSKSLVMPLLGALAAHRDSEVGSAIGWFLATTWNRDHEVVERWLSANAGKLSRRVFRIAVGRMPSPVRVRLLDKWKAAR